jgi:hypothetical protein
LYVGGSFTEVGNGLSANRIAKFDTTQNSNAGWSALGEGLNGGVLALASIGADLYVGGSFTGVVNGIVARRVAKFDSTQHGNAAWSALGDGVTGSAVHSMVAIGTDLYVGGQFTEAGEKTAANIAKFDSTQSNNSGWSPLSSGVDGFGVRALTAVGTDLYVGGGFSNAGGVSASGIAKFDATTLTWSELGGGVSGAATTSSVGTMATIGTDLYVGGDFQEAGGQPAPHVAVYDTRSDDKSGWSALGDGANNDVRAMAPIGNALYVGGQFTEAGGKFNYFFARHEVEDHIFQDRFQQQP